jgi:hypothetical protein
MGFKPVSSHAIVSAVSQIQIEKFRAQGIIVSAGKCSLTNPTETMI